MSDGTSAAGTDVVYTDGTYTAAPGSFSGTFIDANLDNEAITISFTYSGFCFRAQTSSDCTRDRLCGVCGNRNGYVFLFFVCFTYSTCILFFRVFFDILARFFFS